MGYYVNRAMCVIAPITAVIAIILFILAIWSTGDDAGRYGATGGLFFGVTVVSSVGALSMYNEVRKPYRTPKLKEKP